MIKCILDDANCKMKKYNIKLFHGKHEIFISTVSGKFDITLDNETIDVVTIFILGDLPVELFVDSVNEKYG